jgi:hypothetical protein
MKRAFGRRPRAYRRDAWAAIERQAERAFSLCLILAVAEPRIEQLSLRCHTWPLMCLAPAPGGN